MRTSVPRLRSVRFKDGRAPLRVLRGDDYAVIARRRVDRVMAALDGRVAGMAIVVWGPDGASVAGMTVTPISKIPSILVPDFVRNRLLAECIESWTLDSIEGPPQKDGA